MKENTGKEKVKTRTKKDLEKAVAYLSRKLYEIHHLLSNDSLSNNELSKLRKSGVFKQGYEIWKHFYEEECRIQGIKQSFLDEFFNSQNIN